MGLDDAQLRLSEVSAALRAKGTSKRLLSLPYDHVLRIHKSFLEGPYAEAYKAAVLEMLDDPLYPLTKQQIEAAATLNAKRRQSALAGMDVVTSRRTIFNNVGNFHADNSYLPDPALINTPMYGRLVSLIFINGGLVLIFFAFLASFSGRRQIFDYTSLFSSNPLFGDANGEFDDTLNWTVLLISGGALHANIMRATKDYWRILWAMWLHTGWMHIIFNVIVQVTYFIMMEPDWGFFRFVTVYMISGITGNMVSMVATPCTTTVGSSGCLYGVMGASIVFQLEYWYAQPRPLVTLTVTIIVIIVSLLSSFKSGADNWAHIGGLFAGICASFATLSDLPFLRADGRDSAECLVSHNSYNDGRMKKILRNHFKGYSNIWQCWTIRCVAFGLLILAWILLSLHNFRDMFLSATSLGAITYHGFEKCCCAFFNEGFQCARCDFYVGDLDIMKYMSNCAEADGGDFYDVYSYRCDEWFGELPLSTEPSRLALSQEEKTSLGYFESNSLEKVVW